MFNSLSTPMTQFKNINLFSYLNRCMTLTGEVYDVPKLYYMYKCMYLTHVFFQAHTCTLAAIFIFTITEELHMSLSLQYHCTSNESSNLSVRSISSKEKITLNLYLLLDKDAYTTCLNNYTIVC